MARSRSRSKGKIRGPKISQVRNKSKYKSCRDNRKSCRAKFKRKTKGKATDCYIGKSGKFQCYRHKSGKSWYGPKKSKKSKGNRRYSNRANYK